MLDNYRRQFFLKYEFEKSVLKGITKNYYLPHQTRLLAQTRLALLPKVAATNKHRNRCVRSGRKHNVLKKMQYSRFIFRDEAYLGHLPGVARLSR